MFCPINGHASDKDFASFPDLPIECCKEHINILTHSYIFEQTKSSDSRKNFSGPDFKIQNFIKHWLFIRQLVLSGSLPLLFH